MVEAGAREVLGDGVRLHVRSWAGARPEIVLLHGLASTSHIWDLVAPRLARRGLGSVAYDQRGHGRSGKPSSGYGFDRTTADAVAVIRATGLRRPVVVGHSWGANVALELAVRRPRRVAGAVLLDGGFAALRDRLDWNAAKEALAPPAFAGIDVDTFLARARRRLGREVTLPGLDAMFLSLVRVDEGGGVRPRLSRANHLRILHALWSQDTVALLRRVRVPTLVLAARSRSVSRDVDGFERAKRDAAATVRAIGGPVSFAWIDGIHDVPLQRPEAVAARIARFSRSGIGVQGGRP